MKNRKKLSLLGIYVLLAVLALIWLTPIIWIFLTSFRGEGSNAVPYFFLRPILLITISDCLITTHILFFSGL